MKNLKYCLWILLTVLLAGLCKTETEGCKEQERIALLQLKSFFTELEWVDDKNSTSNCCEWERVECSITSRRVIGLTLNFSREWNGPVDLVASLFFPFQELKRLHLPGNQIAGFIHDDRVNLSSALHNLEFLDLSDNFFDDNDLSSLSELSSLKNLDLSFNNIETFPYFQERKSQQMINLESLDLSFNGLKNTSLEYIKGLPSLKSLKMRASIDINVNLSLGSYNLEFLDLSDNYLDDNGLSSLSGLSSLKILDLSYNDIETFRFFQERTLQQLINLESLDLSYNRLKNTSLEYISGLPSLKSLNIGRNEFRSIDIKELNKLTNLKKLDLGSNGLQSLGSFHDGERQFKLVNLEELDLSGNYLNNSFLAHLRGLPNLKSLNIGGNQLKGSINIKELDVFNNLEELDISDNELKEFVAPKEERSLGKIKIANLDYVFSNPNEAASLPYILELFSSAKTLFLRENNFNRTLSSAQEFHASNNIKVLLLDDSYLYNHILESISALASLKTLSLFDCGLTGTLPPQGWCDLRNLEVLDLSGNALEGTLPSCLGNLSSLGYLDISQNQFTGNGPSTSIGNLKLLRVVSLSGNLFQVPSFLSSFANCSHLKVLLSNENKLVTETTSQTWVPKFQLKAFRMSNCSAKDLYSELPRFLYYQYDLRIIDLSYDNIGGKIPFWLLENNTRLEAFLMTENSFSGPLHLPSHPTVNMSIMDISVNEIEGGIPRNICSTFPQLRYLNLSSNALQGEIPHCFGVLNTDLQLDLSFNQLSGRILEELAKSDSLVLLRLSNNNLSGTIPPKMFSIRSLHLLYLDGNNFDGEIPSMDTSTASLSRLVDVDLSNNNLSGKLPRWIWNVLGLFTLASSNNKLEGPLPLDLCNSDMLQILDISKNNISGPIPSCFNAKHMIHLHLGSNRLSGNLTSSFFNSSSLVTLDLSENHFTGEIPSWVGALSSLSVLLLKANYLTGEIPIQLCESSSLSIIDFSENKLSGHIPSCLVNLTLEPNDEKSVPTSYGGDDSPYATHFNYGITEFEAQSLRIDKDLYVFSSIENHMKVQVDYTTKKNSYTYKGNILNYMSGIDLSCNRLSGQIPIELGNLEEIRSLNLSHNNLTGFIPSSFSKLKQIESLDLSYNNLNGTIPDQLIELNALAIFDVSYNNLSGSIPDQKAQFGTFDENSYLGNPYLCGPPLHKSCTKSNSTPTIQKSSEDEEESGLVDEQVFLVTFFVSYAAVLMGIAAALYINPYWRRLWFYFIEKAINNVRYFVEDTFRKLPIFRRT